MTSATHLAALTDHTEVIAALSDLLVEVVANGGSVSFMHPLARDVAADFWKGSLARAASGGRVVLGAWEGDDLIGTVTLDLATPPNQPHRAEIAKLMTRVSRRGRGVARSLMLEAERIAVERGRTLLVLDTAADGGAAGLYEGLGYHRVGVIPGYALKPHGGLSGTIIYFKPIGPAAEKG
ncbi:MAG TPA: GNAT family N-acetyltransferase [Candidatus Binataceae bacterium]|nr:GNAT family N-acetyltransferase [Candidatus Binataceae bacterium]